MFDAVLVRQTVRTSGIHGLAKTKLDILDGFDEINACVAYRLDGREDYLPAGEHAQARVEPIYGDDRGLAGAHRARPLVGRAAGAGDQVRAADRRADQLPARLAIDEPGAAGHYSLMRNPFES